MQHEKTTGFTRKSEIIAYLKSHPDKPTSVIARRFNCGVGRVLYHRNKLGLPTLVHFWTAEEEQQLLTLKEQGYTYKALSELYNTTIENISVRLSMARKKYKKE